MERLVARVKGGRLVLNEPTDLPEGTEVELEAVPDLDLTPEERERLNAASSESIAQAERGETVPADEVFRRLRAMRE
jgi:thymidine phosphorylase